LDQVKVNETAPAATKDKKDKKDSPREEQKDSLQNSESKKKCNSKFRNNPHRFLAANWVPLPIEVQTR
jgi:hypothetical protein